MCEEKPFRSFLLKCAVFFLRADVIAFKVDGDGKKARLFRIARNISLHEGQESALESGQYGIKVGIWQSSVRLHRSWMSKVTQCWQVVSGLNRCSRVCGHGAVAATVHIAARLTCLLLGSKRLFCHFSLAPWRWVGIHLKVSSAQQGLSGW